MFIRLYNTEGLLELASSTSYGQLIQEFLVLAKANPNAYNYAQIGDIKTHDNDPAQQFTLEGMIKAGIKELTVIHPVLLDRFDKWIAVPQGAWARFVSVCHQSGKRGTAIYYSFGRERKWTVTNSLEFFHKLFYNLETTALDHYGPPPGDVLQFPQLMDSIQQGCVTKAIEAYKLNQIQLTL